MDKSLDSKSLERLSEIYKQLSNPIRLKIMLYLQRGSACVSELCEVTTVSQSATSQNLKKLKENRLIKQNRQAQKIYYSLFDSHIQKLLEIGLKHIQGG